MNAESILSKIKKSECFRLYNYCYVSLGPIRFNELKEKNQMRSIK
jgi:hypothetical protein